MIIFGSQKNNLEILFTYVSKANALIFSFLLQRTNTVLLVEEMHQEMSS